MEIQGAKHMISIKNKDFHVTQDQKYNARGHKVLLEHSQVLGIFLP